MRTVRGKVSACLIGAFALSVLPNVTAAQSRLPKNAALVYYQACLKNLELQWPEEAWSVLAGSDPNDGITEFTKHPACQEIIFLVNTAIGIQDCDWALIPSGIGTPERFVATRLMGLARLYSLHARVLAAEGQYRAAFEGALRLQRFGKHIGDDVYGMWVMSESVNNEAFRLIQYVLGVMPPDVETLTWLQGRIAREQGPPWRPAETLRKWRDMEILAYQARPCAYLEWKNALPQRIQDQTLRTEMEKLTPTEALQRAEETLDSFLKSALETLHSDLPHKAKYAEIRKLIDPLDERRGNGDPIEILILPVTMLDPYYRLHVNGTVAINAVTAAMEIYLIKARMGQLPESLPEGLPKDPYSGEDFEYQTTDEGFSLRCRALVDDFRELRRFHFKVRREEN